MKVEVERKGGRGGGDDIPTEVIVLNIFLGLFFQCIVADVLEKHCVQKMLPVSLSEGVHNEAQGLRPRVAHEV